jgi:glutaredoxin
MAKFAGLNAQVLGISVDSVPCLAAWAQSLGEINFPLLSDFWPHGLVASRYGVLHPRGHTERAIFIVDQRGVIQYIDIHDISKQPDNEIVLEKLRELQPEARRPRAQHPEGPELPAGGVTMYCSSWCPDCTLARAWLRDYNVDYVEVDVNSVPGAAARVRQWADGNLVTPTFDINGTIVVDFDKQRLQELLG